MSCTNILLHYKIKAIMMLVLGRFASMHYKELARPTMAKVSSEVLMINAQPSNRR